MRKLELYQTAFLAAFAAYVVFSLIMYAIKHVHFDQGQRVPKEMSVYFD